MGLVQNLKKKFNNWVDRTLAELCSAYIKQLAKQTTRKQDNYLIIKYLQSNLTTGHQSSIIATSSQDTSGKTIMELKTTEEVIAHTREWAIDKVESAKLVGDKIALYEEFVDWIDIEDGDPDFEVITFNKLDDEE